MAPKLRRANADCVLSEALRAHSAVLLTGPGRLTSEQFLKLMPGEAGTRRLALRMPPVTTIWHKLVDIETKP